MKLDKYIKAFSTLRMNPSMGHKSPHKVCLLLAVIDLIESGEITKNCIYFNEQLTNQFTHHFNELKQRNDRDNPFQPFFYLNSEGFWHHKVRAGQEPEYQRRNKERKAGSEGIVNRLIEYAYLDKSLFKCLQSQNNRNKLRLALGSNIEDYSGLFARWALNIGKSQKTVDNYLQAIGGSISNWIADADITDNKLLSMNSYKQFESITSRARKLGKFRVSDSKGKGMYSAALNCYGEFLCDLTQEAVIDDIQTVINDTSIEKTTQETLVNARVGQGRFRTNLLEYWQGCALTGYGNTALLIASHIKPWRDSTNTERLDVYNGLLLLPNLDKAFDKGYISFSTTGKIIISSALEEPGALGVEKGMSINLIDSHKEYLSFHRDRIYKRLT